MPIRLNAGEPDFESRFETFLGTKREASPDVDDAVRSIIARIRSEGDAALIDLTRRFDGLDLTPDTLRVTPDEIAAAVAATPQPTMDALKFAHERIRRHHERQRPKDDLHTDAPVSYTHLTLPTKA